MEIVAEDEVNIEEEQQKGDKEDQVELLLQVGQPERERRHDKGREKEG